MQLIVIRGETPLEYLKSMLTAKAAVLDAGYTDEEIKFGAMFDLDSDVWDFQGSGREWIRVVWSEVPDGPMPTEADAQAAAKSLGYRMIGSIYDS